MKIEDLADKDIAINCKTLQEAQSFMKLIKEELGDIINVKANEWNWYREETCYNIKNGLLGIGFVDILKGKYKILEFSKVEFSQ